MYRNVVRPILLVTFVGAIILGACGSGAVKYIEPAGAKGVLQVIHKATVPQGSLNYVVDVSVANISDKEVGATDTPGGGALKVVIARKGMLGEENGGLPPEIDTDFIIGSIKAGKTEIMKFRVPKKYGYEITIEGFQ